MEPTSAEFQTRSVVHCNNMAVSSLLSCAERQRHCKRDTVVMLRNALQDYKNLFDENSHQSKSFCQPIPHDLFELQGVRFGSQYEGESGVFCFYNRLFLINHETAMYEVCLPQIGAVLLFNLGCLFHSQGEQVFISGRSARMAKAANLYNNALMMLSQSSLEGASLSLLYMALQNNLGHIYSTLGNRDEASLCFQQMQQSFRCRSTSNIPEDDYLFFAETVLVFQNGNLLSTAAAA